MRRPAPYSPLLILALAGMVGCADTPPEPTGEFNPDYKGIETVLLDEGIVNFKVTMAGARHNQDVSDYARCAAAQFALIRGFGFTRHVRTNVAFQGGLWRADAVYTISSTLPQGLRTLDAEVTVRDCAAQGIPTV